MIELKNSFHRKNLLGLLAGASLVSLAAPGWAQEASPTASEATELNVIVVTARRKAEDILKTPVAISALTAEEVQARGIISMQDVAQFTPGMNVVGQASNGGRADRSFQSVVIRGMPPSTANLQTTSVFIDGVPVSSATALQTFGNPERIEVLKGPQAAYFGRQTFGGAINLVTKSPTDEISGSINGAGGTRNNFDLGAEIGGPIFGDLLGFRLQARTFGKDGSYKNAGVRTETLGDQSTKTASMALVFKPTSDVTVKAYGMITTLDDGAPAQGLIGAYSVTDRTGAAVVSDQSNCTLKTNRFICGTAPKLSSLTPSANTVVTQTVRDLLNSSAGRVVSAEDGVDDYGLKNRFYHLHLAADWAVGDTGLTLSSLTGYNNERKSELADFDNFYSDNTANPFGPATIPNFNYPFLVEGVNHDISQEFRGTFDNGGPLHLTGGVSYLNAWAQTSSGGGNGVLVSRISGATRNKTYGAFWGVGYDITEKLTVNFDGRYQIDKLYAYSAPGGTTATNSIFIPAGFYPAGSVLLQKKYKNFMPRFIANYDIDEHNMVYATFSKGVNPGVFNTSFLTAASTAIAAAEAAGVSVAIDPEKLENYELGAKGRLFGNKLTYDVSAFYDNWTDQINQQAINFTDVNNTAQQVIASTNTGHVHVSGVEAAFTAYVTRELTVDLSGAYIDSKIVKAANSNTTILTGLTDFKGKQSPFVAKWSGSASVQYTKAVPGLDDVDGFIRGDFTFKSGSYSDMANVLKSPNTTQFNLRAGAKSDKFTVEGFVTNLFNNKAYYSVVDGYVVNPTFTHFAAPSAAIVQLRELRTIGLRIGYNF